MRTRKKRIIGVLLVLTAFVLTVLGWVWATAGTNISTDNAYLRADVTSIAAKVGGYVTVVEVGDNQAVQAGDILFRIDDRDYRARLGQAEAAVDAANARIANTEQEIRLQTALIRQAGALRQGAMSELTLADKIRARRLDLIDDGAVSRAQLEESDAGWLQARAGLSASSAALEAQQLKINVLVTQRDAAFAALKQAEAVRDIAVIDLENTTVRAPISGVVGNRQIRVGRLVAPGSALLEIVPLADIFVVANFKETQIEGVQPGQPVRIWVDGYPSVLIEGVVDSFAPGSGSFFSLIPPDNATGNFVRVVQRVSVKIRLRKNPLLGRLVPGLSARVQIDPVKLP